MLSKWQQLFPNLLKKNYKYSEHVRSTYTCISTVSTQFLNAFISHILARWELAKIIDYTHLLNYWYYKESINRMLAVEYTVQGVACRYPVAVES